MMQDEVRMQRQYYMKTAGRFEEWHHHEGDEHFFALGFLVGMIDYLKVESVLDVGSGTGRAVRYIKQRKPAVKVIGIEPVRESREIGYQHGLSKSELLEGDATSIAFGDGEFDLVCEFGALHHISNHQVAVSEMLRVAKKAIFISDCNNFGQGSLMARTIKQMVNAIGLWKVADFIKTGGKGYDFSEGDGLTYSYSVFNDYRVIQKHCKSIHLLNTRAGGVNPYRSAGHVGLLGVKKECPVETVKLLA